VLAFYFFKVKEGVRGASFYTVMYVRGLFSILPEYIRGLALDNPRTRRATLFTRVCPLQTKN
jgi:hypothetical protein